MNGDDGNPNGFVIFMIVAMPIVIGALIGFLTYVPPHHH